MPNFSYYPTLSTDRAKWWGRVLTHAPHVLSTAGFSALEIAAVLADARWAFYCYDDLRRVYAKYHSALLAYTVTVLRGDPEAPLGDPPAPPPLPTPPVPAARPGVETRRARWVARFKNMPDYHETLGLELGVEGNMRRIAARSRGARLRGLASPAAGIVTGRFAKGGGSIEGIVLYGQPVLTAGAELAVLGRFTASPFRVRVPLAGAGPEEWQFQARTLRRDQEFGEPSPLYALIVRGA